MVYGINCKTAQETYWNNEHITPLYAFLKTHWVLYLKHVYFVLCKFYLNKFKILKIQHMG